MRSSDIAKQKTSDETSVIVRVSTEICCRELVFGELVVGEMVFRELVLGELLFGGLVVFTKLVFGRYG